MMEGGSWGQGVIGGLRCGEGKVKGGVGSNATNK